MIGRSAAVPPLAVAVESSGAPNLRRRRFEAFDDRPLEETRAIAVAADRLGYDAVFVPESVGRDAFVVLTDLAAQTSRIRLGTGVVNVFSRTPAAIAMAAASLDEVCCGRLLLGLGTSGSPLLEDWHGMSASRPLRRLREVTLAIRALLARARDGFEGDTVRIARNWALRFSPHRSTIPILHGSLSARAIAQCSEVADGWLPSLMSPAAIARALAQAPGPARSSTFLVAAYFPSLVSDDPEWARRVVSRQIAFYAGRLSSAYRASLVRQGYGAALEHLGDRSASASAREPMLPSDVISSLSVSGPTAACQRQLDRIRESGVTLPVLLLPTSLALDECLQTIEALAPVRWETVAVEPVVAVTT